jgi:prepilin-type N-terminal cleavage/methylation domain-containing protein
MTKPRPNADRCKPRRGFTLTELMVVMVIIGVMAAMSVPSYQRAIEQSRADIAGANLRAIWAAERLYWLENNSYTSDIATLQNMGVLDRSIPTDSSKTIGGYGYAISIQPEAPDPATSFTATATRIGNTGATYGSYSITEHGWPKNNGEDAPGTVTIIPNYPITLGFQ